MHSKGVLGSLYNKKNKVSNFDAIINDCRQHLFATNLMNSRVKFIKRQTNEVTHIFVKYMYDL